MEAILNRRPPSTLSLLISFPIRTLARFIYSFRQQLLSPNPPHRIPITTVCISDTHNTYPLLPGGDILIHAGDLSKSGTLSEIQATVDWVAQQQHRHKIVIAGNHDLLLDPAKNPYQGRKEELNWHDVIYLRDSCSTLRFPGGRTLKVCGSPWTRKHGNPAFEYPTGSDHWTGTVPDDTDVLVTHMPPFAHLDLEGSGDRYLMREVQRVKPRLHVFGHFMRDMGGRRCAGMSLRRRIWL